MILKDFGNGVIVTNCELVLCGNALSLSPEKMAAYAALAKEVIQSWSDWEDDPRIAKPSDPRASFDKKRPGLLRSMLESGATYRCVVCGAKKDIQIDHIIPLSAGGSNDLDNLQFLCSFHNQSKGSKSEARRPPNPMGETT